MECNITMYEAVRRASLEASKCTAVYYQGTKISFKKFIKLIDRMADILYNRLGIREGDTILLAEPNILMF